MANKSIKPDVRRAMQTKVQVLKRQLVLDDPIYRTILNAQTGKNSTKEMDKAELAKVIEYLNQQLGLNQKKPSRNELLAEIATLINLLGRKPNYSKAILAKITPNSRLEASDYELEKLRDALKKQRERELKTGG